MTAEQIRTQKFECDDGLWECARWMQELAAQFAEFNERERFALQPNALRQVPPARPADPTSGTDQARAILSPPAAAQSMPTIALRDRWARDKHGVEVPRPDAEPVTVRIWKQERRDLADKTPRLKVSWANPSGKGFVDAACWDEKLFPWIAAQSKEPTATLYVVRAGKYLNVAGVKA